MQENILWNLNNFLKISDTICSGLLAHKSTSKAIKPVTKSKKFCVSESERDSLELYHNKFKALFYMHFCEQGPELA